VKKTKGPDRNTTEDLDQRRETKTRREKTKAG